VDAVAEREVLRRIPREIELVGPVEDQLVAVRGAEECEHAVARPDSLARERGVARRAPAIALNGAVEAEKLLDRRARGLRRPPDGRERGRALEEGEEPVPDEIGAGLVAREQECHARADELAEVERLGRRRKSRLIRSRPGSVPRRAIRGSR
jgi:hypothetical protein